MKRGNFSNPNGVVIIQPRVGVATPTLGGLYLGPTLKGLYQRQTGAVAGLIQLFQSWEPDYTYPG
jgi:hypothetical protein